MIKLKISFAFLRRADIIQGFSQKHLKYLQSLKSSISGNDVPEL